MQGRTAWDDVRDSLIGKLYRVGSCVNCTDAFLVVDVKSSSPFKSDPIKVYNLTNDRHTSMHFQEWDEIDLKSLISVDYKDLTKREAENLAYFELRQKEGNLAKEVVA